jgi:hypothetical protein
LFELCTWLGWGDPFCKDLRTSLSLSLSLSLNSLSQLGLKACLFYFGKRERKSKPELHTSPFFRGPMCAIMLMLPWEKGGEFRLGSLEPAKVACINLR